MKNTIAYLILAVTIIFNLWLYFPETQILADPNDNIFQFSLVGRTNWVWENYGCPLSLSCLPNLIDHNVPNWAEGYPLPFYYSHVPQIATVASYNLIIKPLSTVTHHQLTIHEYYNWIKYLLLAFFPLSVFLALRIISFSPVLSAMAAFFAANFSTDGLYGIDPPSYLWRGYGLTSQLYAIIFLPLAIAFTYKALHTSDITTGGTKEGSQTKLHKEAKIKYTLYTGGLKRSLGYLSDRTRKLRSNNLLLASLFLTLTTMGHLGIGIIGVISTIPFLFFDLNPQHIWQRVKKLFLIGLGLLFILAYWIIPVLLYDKYHIISFWDPIWKFNSYGWYEVIRQFLNGEIFDWQRFPIITILVTVGFFVLFLRKKYLPFVLLFAFWFLLYFGRTTWGGLFDLIPGMRDFHQHRFVVGVHITALFLIPAGLEWIYSFILNLKNKILNIHIKYQKFGIEDARANLNITFYILIFIFVSILAYFTARQTIAYATLNNKWIYQANDAYRYDENNFKNLLTKIDSSPKGRIYAGRPGNWGNDFRLGSTQLYLLLGGIGYDISQFLPETWSPLSENEQDFDEREAVDFDLLNINTVVAPNLPAGLSDGKAGKAGNEGFASAVNLIEKYGPFNLFSVPTTGWFKVVTSPMMVKSDKTNYLNIVHLWWNSYARRWNMFPIISVENDPQIPTGLQKVIEMKDEVNYYSLNPFAGGAKEGSQTSASLALSTTKWSDFEDVSGKLSQQDPQNIFTDFPFIFPQATVSGQIKNETVSRQTYSATVEAPPNCKSCLVMFKMSYHPDWTVKVDGKDAQKLAVFPFYLATPISPGTHTVEFTYQPNGLKIFLLIGEIIAVIIFLFRKKIKKLFSSL